MRLARGDSGMLVADVNRLLASRGYQLPASKRYTDATFRALKMFQISQGLAATGVADSVTWILLRGSDTIKEELLLGQESPSAVSCVTENLRIGGLGAVAMDLQMVAVSRGLKLGFLAALVVVECTDPVQAMQNPGFNLFGLVDPETLAPSIFRSHREAIDCLAARLIEDFIAPQAPFFMGGTLSSLSVFGLSARHDVVDGAVWVDAVADAWIKLRRLPSRLEAKIPLTHPAVAPR